MAVYSGIDARSEDIRYATEIQSAHAPGGGYATGEKSHRKGGGEPHRGGDTPSTTLGLLEGGGQASSDKSFRLRRAG